MEIIYNQVRYILPLWFVLLITNWFPDNKITIKIRGVMAKKFIKKCGKNFTLGRDVTINNSHRLIIGDNVYIAKGVWINCLGGITIEDEVVIAPYVVISSLQHCFKNGSVRFAESLKASVLIGKGSWLAAHVSVKCGVSIGKGNLIAANAFVANSTDDFKVLGGVPARVIKDNN